MKCKLVTSTQDISAPNFLITLSLELREASNNLNEMLHPRVNKEVC
jgi:hypothetical protein